jgi:hypothetical protein
MTALFRKSRSFLLEGRSARTPPSTFLFLPIHLSNSPETLRFPTSRRTEKPTKFEPPTSSRRSCPHISEELQRRVITPLADGTPYDRAYMCHPSSVSTTKHKLSRRSNSARIQRLSHSLRVPAPRLLAALEPHSSAVLAPVKDQGTSEGT